MLQFKPTPKRYQTGFTLLEVMVAVSMLALSITAMAAINANSFEASNYARGITVATLLARGKMLDLEIELQKDGFGTTEKTFDGEFSKEGFPGVSWRAIARPVDIDITPLVESFFGGELSPDNLPEQMQSFVGALNGEALGADGAVVDESLQETVQGGDVAQLLGGNQTEAMFKQISEVLAESIREISLEIAWGQGLDRETIKFVQYLTTSGRLSANIRRPPSPDDENEDGEGNEDGEDNEDGENGGVGTPGQPGSPGSPGSPGTGGQGSGRGNESDRE